MQRETSALGQGKSAVSAFSPFFTGDYDFHTSLCSSIFAPRVDNESSSVYGSGESDDSLTSCLTDTAQLQQQLLHQDLMERHNRLLSHLCDVFKQAQSLRQENVNLKMTNLELKCRLNSLIKDTAFGVTGLNPVLGVDPTVDGMRKMSLGAGEEGTSEKEKVVESPTSVMHSDQGGRGEGERISLPKSISVRSSGYLKASRADEGDGKGGARAKASKQAKVDTGTQKVYVGGKEEQALELEVYHQGMFKTELCNKWQQTGTCPYNENCQFAHGVAELRPVIRHPRYKTEVCRMVLNGVSCPYGHRCHFRHALTEEEKLAKAINFRSLDPLNYR